MVTPERLADIKEEQRRARGEALRLANTAATPQERIVVEKLIEWVEELKDYARRLQRPGEKWRVL